MNCSRSEANLHCFSLFWSISQFWPHKTACRRYSYSPPLRIPPRLSARQSHSNPSLFCSWWKSHFHICVGNPLPTDSCGHFPWSLPAHFYFLPWYFYIAWLFCYFYTNPQPLFWSFPLQVLKQMGDPIHDALSFPFVKYKRLSRAWNTAFHHLQYFAKWMLCLVI